MTLIEMLNRQLDKAVEKNDLINIQILQFRIVDALQTELMAPTENEAKGMNWL